MVARWLIVALNRTPKCYEVRFEQMEILRTGRQNKVVVDEKRVDRNRGIVMLVKLVLYTS